MRICVQHSAIISNIQNERISGMPKSKRFVHMFAERRHCIQFYAHCTAHHTVTWRIHVHRQHHRDFYNLFTIVSACVHINAEKLWIKHGLVIESHWNIDRQTWILCRRSKTPETCVCVCAEYRNISDGWRPQNRTKAMRNKRACRRKWTVSVEKGSNDLCQMPMLDGMCD